MRGELSTLLTERYPALYGHRGPAYPFEHHNGWAGLLDALSEVLVRHAEADGRPPPRAQQVKEKFGCLRWYFGTSAADMGAIDLACEMSERTCEISGRPGRLGCRAGWWATRAPGLDGFEYRYLGRMENGVMGVPELGFRAADVREWRSDVLTGLLKVPYGWLDLADALLACLGLRAGHVRRRSSGVLTIRLGGQPDDVDPPVRIDRLERLPTGDLGVEYTGSGLYAAGAVACAIALARRIDPDTGVCGALP